VLLESFGTDLSLLGYGAQPIAHITHSDAESLSLLVIISRIATRRSVLRGRTSLANCADTNIWRLLKKRMN
jgi:hypothetical protein